MKTKAYDLNPLPVKVSRDGVIVKTSGQEDVVIPPFWAIASTVSSGICAYHGYKRNDSVGWGIGWALLGGLFPIITPAIAFAQGFGVRKI